MKLSMRNSRGGVLPLIMLAGVVLILVTIVAVSVCALLLIESKLRSTGENLCLQSGVQLNRNDRITEMNLMVERSREAVYTGRQTYDKIEETAPHVAPLAQLLLDDARDGARLVEEERSMLSGSLGKEIEVSMSSEMDKLRKAAPAKLMLFELNQSDQVTVDVGYVKDVPSNASVAIAVPELKEHDQQSGFLYGKTDYFRHGVNATLPAPDNDLTFKFASLAPKIKDTIAEPRLINSEDFTKVNTLIAPGQLKRPTLGELTTAIRVTTQTGISAPLALEQDMSTSVVSTSTGATKDE